MTTLKIRSEARFITVYAGKYRMKKEIIVMAIIAMPIFFENTIRKRNNEDQTCNAIIILTGNLRVIALQLNYRKDRIHCTSRSAKQACDPFPNARYAVKIKFYLLSDYDCRFFDIDLVGQELRIEFYTRTSLFYLVFFYV